MSYYSLTPAMARSGVFRQAPEGAHILPGTPRPAIDMSLAGVRLQYGVGGCVWCGWVCEYVSVDHKGVWHRFWSLWAVLGLLWAPEDEVGRLKYEPTSNVSTQNILST